MFQTINPATGEVLQTYNDLSLQEIDSIVEKATRTFQLWREVAVSAKAEVLRKLAGRFRARKHELAALMNQEMGKSLSEGLAEIEKCAATCEYFAKMGAEFLKPQVIEIPESETVSEVHFEPQGIVFSIMPWNFPFWQFIRFAAPSLMIGNVILLKHAQLTAGCGALIEELCSEIWDERLVFNLTIDHAAATHLIQNPKIRGVTFTGSTRGGRQVAKTAGEALKKTVLELGGSDAYIIMADADIEKAAEICAKGRMINNGQSCVAAKRFIAHQDIFEHFVRQLKAELSAYPTAVLASAEAQSHLQGQVEKMKSLGGEVLLGGQIPPGVGAFYPPTLVVFAKDQAEIHQEELFGPVALVLKADSVEEAFAIANSSPFGLGGGIFSENAEKAQELVAKKMEAGFVVVNGSVKSDPRLPFGGVKDSGFGRELGSFGFYEFCNIKTVVRGS